MENYFHICSKVFHLTKSRRNTNNSERIHVNIFFSSPRALLVDADFSVVKEFSLFLSLSSGKNLLEVFFSGAAGRKRENPGNNNEMKVYFYTLNLYNFQTTIERRTHNTNELTFNHGVKWDGIAYTSLFLLYRLLDFLSLVFFSFLSWSWEEA